MDAKRIFRVSELLLYLTDEAITAEQMQELESLLLSDRTLLEYAVDYLIESNIIRRECRKIPAQESSAEMTTDFDTDLWKMLAQFEIEAPAIEIPQEKVQKEPVEMLKFERTPRVVHKSSIYAVIASVAAALLIALMVVLKPVRPTVAMLTDSIDAEWAYSKSELVHGDLLRQEELTLVKGFAEITFDDGAVVLVEAPAKFELESSSMLFLSSGKLFSVVPPEAVGFTVRTAQAEIVDFGTEFGVAVEESGQVNTYVFSGKVRVSSSDQKKDKETLWLTQGQAAATDHDGNLSRQNSMHNKRIFVQGIETAESWRSYLDVNLIQNPGFEQGTIGDYTPEVTGKKEVGDVAIQGWQDETAATVYTYHGSTDDFPRLGHDPIPDNCGQNFFVGMTDNEIYQDISVGQLGYLIDDGNGLSFKLSGWLGGYDSHKDSLLVTASFRDKQGQEISRTSIGPVSAAERKNQTMFIYKQADGAVPTGTDTIRIILKTTRSYGMADSFADNLKLVLTINKDISSLLR